MAVDGELTIDAASRVDRYQDVTSGADENYVPAPPLGSAPQRLGYAGPPVEQVQELLNLAGIPVEVTGYYDVDTQIAVCAFQQMYGLRQTGIVNDWTLDALLYPDRFVRKKTPEEVIVAPPPVWLGIAFPRHRAATAAAPQASSEPLPPTTPAAMAAQRNGAAAAPSPVRTSARAGSVERVRNVPADPTAARIVEMARAAVGSVDYSQRDADGPHGWKYLQTVFRETTGMNPSDAEMKSTSHPDRKQWCGIWATYIYREAGAYNGRWNLNGSGPDGGIQKYAQWDKRFGSRAQFEGAIMPGDIVVFPQFSHHAIVVSVDGDTMTTVDGNAGYGQILERKTHRLSEVQAFYRAQGSTGPF